MDRISENNSAQTFKIIVLGSAGVGKTSLMQRYTDDVFQSSMATVGVDFKIKTLYRTNEIIKLQIWDTAGQERFRSVSQIYYRGTHGILLCYDTSSYQSFENLKRFCEELQNFFNPQGQQIPPVILCGLKADLEYERQVAPDEAMAFAEAKGQIFCENSSKNKMNVNETFDLLVDEMIKRRRIQQMSNQVQDQLLDSIGNLQKTNNPAQKRKDCC